MSQNSTSGANLDNRAKWWEIMFFSLNNSATNIYLFAFGFLSYYVSGFLGLATVTIGNILGFIRLFDGLIDPPIGMLMDQVNTKYGKYRPFMIVGNIILIISFLMLFNCHRIESEMLRYVVLCVSLIIHKIGYSFQASVTKAAQPVLTSDPKQRPQFTIWDTIFSNILVMTLGIKVVADILVPKAGGDYNLEFFKMVVSLTIVISAVMTVFAVIGIQRKDREEYFGLGEETVETSSLKDYWQVLKDNRPFVTLITSSAIVKFVTQTIGDVTVTTMLFGIVLANYSLSGTVATYVVVPNLVIIFALSGFASRRGQRASYRLSAFLATICLILMGFLLVKSDTVNMYEHYKGQWWAFVALYIGIKVFSGYPTSVSLTMTADVSEYETAISGRYVSGMMGTMFSLTDSIASALTPICVNWVVAAVGFRDSIPSVQTPYSDQVFKAVLILYVIIPLIGYLIVNILMKIYPLDLRMIEHSQKIVALKKQGRIPNTANGFDYAEQNNIDLDAVNIDL